MDQSPKPSTSYAGVLSGTESNSDQDEASPSWLTAYQVENEEEATAIALAESLKSGKVVDCFCCPVLTCSPMFIFCGFK